MNIFFWNIKNANFGRQNEHSIFCDVVTTWTKSIAIQCCTKQISIRKKNSGRTIPAFHHSCPIMVEGLFVAIHILVVLPWFWDTCHKSQRKRHSIHQKEFQSVVQHGRVGTSSINCRKNCLHLFWTKNWRMKSFFAGQHTVNVSTNGVNFAIVGNKTVWMGTLPAWLSICRKAGMNNCQ